MAELTISIVPLNSYSLATDSLIHILVLQLDELADFHQDLVHAVLEAFLSGYDVVRGLQDHLIALR